MPSRGGINSNSAKARSSVNDIDKLNINGQNETNDIPEFAEEPIRLTQCRDCGRKFKEDALAKHMKICKKVFVQKRKPFDIKQARNSEIQQEIEKLEGFAKYN